MNDQAAERFLHFYTLRAMQAWELFVKESFLRLCVPFGYTASHLWWLVLHLFCNTQFETSCFCYLAARQRFQCDVRYVETWRAIFLCCNPVAMLKHKCLNRNLLKWRENRTVDSLISQVLRSWKLALNYNAVMDRIQRIYPALCFDFLFYSVLL